MIPRVLGETGHQQIPDPGKPGKSFDTPAESNAESRHFRESPGHQGGHRIIPKPESVGDSRRDRIDVLDRAAQLDAREIRAGVGAELR